MTTDFRHPPLSRSFTSPEEAESAFYQAFEHLDSALMAEVWSGTSNSLCIHPGGELLRGRAEILRSWAAIFSNARPPSIVVRLLQRFERPGIAVHLVEELIRPKRNSSTEGTRVFATNIYLEQNAGWNMIEHHASIPIVSHKESRSSLH